MEEFFKIKRAIIKKKLVFQMKIMRDKQTHCRERSHKSNVEQSVDWL